MQTTLTQSPSAAIRPLVVIPVYNNRATLRRVTEEAMATGLDVLVVNDGSTDGGPDTLAGLDVARLDLPVNQGKGAAILAAAEWAGRGEATHLITVDADGQHDAAEAVRFVEAIGQNPLAIIVGARDLAGAAAPGGSRFGRHFSNFWLRAATGISLPDSQCGYRAYPIAALRRLPLRARRYDFEVEVLVRGAWAGLALESIPIRVHYPPGDERVTHFDQLRDNWRISRVYARCVTRHLLPLPHRRLFTPRETPDALSLRRPLASLRRLLRESTTPAEIAAACALGLFLGTLPLIACHGVVILFCATRLRLNRLVAFNISHLCAPPLVPALAIEAGYFMRHGRFLVDFNWQTLGHEAPQRLLDYLLGSLVVGPVLATTGGVLVYGAVLAGKRKITPTDAAGRSGVDGDDQAPDTQPVQSPNYGGRLGHNIFHWLIRLGGVGPAYALLALVVPYYVLIRASARRSAQPYLRRRFPGQRPLARLWATMRYFYRFGQVLIDQGVMGILGPGRFKIDFPGEDQLYRAAQAGRGVVLLTTHAGAWRSAMTAMDCLDVPVWFQFRHDPHMNGRHFFDLAGQRSRFRFVSPGGFLGGVVELTQALARGECVAVMGDRAWGARTQSLPFLGEVAAFPVIPYQLALRTGAEIFVLLTARTGRLACRIECTRITPDPAGANSDGPAPPRESAARELGRRYVECLEAYLAKYPFMWFNFFDIWNSADSARAREHRGERTGANNNARWHGESATGTGTQDAGHQ